MLTQPRKFKKYRSSHISQGLKAIGVASRHKRRIQHKCKGVCDDGAADTRRAIQGELSHGQSLFATAGKPGLWVAMDIVQNAALFTPKSKIDSETSSASPAVIS